MKHGENITAVWTAFLAQFITPTLVAILISCAAGSYASFGFGDKVEPRSRMFNLWFVCLIMGLAFTVIVNAVVSHFTKIEMTTGLQAANGAIVSCLTRFWLPSLIDSIRSGEWKKWIPFLNRT